MYYKIKISNELNLKLDYFKVLEEIRTLCKEYFLLDSMINLFRIFKKIN